MKEAARACGRAVASVSLGQYHTKLYHSGSKPMHSSVCGGVVSLLLVIPLVIYCSYLLFTTFNRSTYLTYEDRYEIKRSDLVLRDLQDSLLNQTF